MLQGNTPGDNQHYELHVGLEIERGNTNISGNTMYLRYWLSIRMLNKEKIDLVARKSTSSIKIENRSCWIVAFGVLYL